MQVMMLHLRFLLNKKSAYRIVSTLFIRKPERFEVRNEFGLKFACIDQPV